MASSYYVDKSKIVRHTIEEKIKELKKTIEWGEFAKKAADIEAGFRYERKMSSEERSRQETRLKFEIQEIENQMKALEKETNTHIHKPLANMIMKMENETILSFSVSYHFPHPNMDVDAYQAFMKQQSIKIKAYIADHIDAMRQANQKDNELRRIMSAKKKELESLSSHEVTKKRTRDCDEQTKENTTKLLELMPDSVRKVLDECFGILNDWNTKTGERCYNCHRIRQMSGALVLENHSYDAGHGWEVDTKWDCYDRHLIKSRTPSPFNEFLFWAVLPEMTAFSYQ